MEEIQINVSPELILNLRSCIVEEEGESVGQLVDHLGRVARAMPGAGFNPDQNRIFSPMLFLQGGDEFERVRGDDTVIVVSAGHERGRIGDSVFDIKER